MIGFTDTQTAKDIPPSVYGPGNGNILLDSLSCLGNETDIADCSHQAWETTDCSPSEDIGVDCRTHVRIEHGSTPHDGQVEVNITGIWQPLCADNFTQSEAKVICRMLGYSANGSYVMSARSKSDLSSISSTAYYCTGNKIDISMCRKRQATCSASTVAAVDCKTLIRLVNGTSQQSGRVEVFHNDAWGTVCDDSFDDVEAKVICRMLGFGTSNAKSLTGAYYGEGQGKIVVDDMNCQGEEVDISDCKSRPWGTSNTCHHNEDAAVECNTELRLIDGPTEYSGRLELRQESKWKTVCSNHFDNKTAQIVCNMLRFERSNISIYTNGRFHGNGAQLIHHGYTCSGNETDIANCKHTYVSLPCTAVGINCYCNTPMRILDGTTMFNGVEIYETFTSSNGYIVFLIIWYTK
ncbi:scavenger receptor cysteine-rich domain superfamily protein-like isoform X1 [Dreissena polymorpha]|uniref:scavenger receptor cysteine-rich domain superfamily protein-like isoform X1 n=2 Tax=Dreissena polymorpha TaxID=45954 RepID=UPI002264F50D|nr:scavenger receptor cysteine-rich domain superfamily protein-like isoform X1 [Dreissena polymorpha]